MGALDRFEIGRRIGDGAAGVVFEARDPVLGRTVALERVAGADERVLRAARAQAQVTHPNVISVYEAIAGDGEIVIVKELAEGEALEAWRAAKPSWRAIVDVFAAIGRGLAAAHARGVAHGAIEAGVVIDRDGVPRLGDFGLRGEGASKGDDLRAYVAALREALDDTRVPPNVRARLARIDRAGSIDAAIAILDRARGGPRRAAIAVGAVAIAAAVATGAWIAGGRGPDEDPCPPPAAKLDPIWGAARRASIVEHIRALDRTTGAPRANALTIRIDRYARRWSDVRVDACRATRAREQPDATLDLRMRCLDRRLDALDDGLAVLASTRDFRALDHALSGLTQLESIEGCSDPKELAAAIPPPRDPAARAAVRALERELDEIEARHKGGALEGLPDRSRAVVARARALRFEPTLSAALAQQVQVAFDVDDFATAESASRELTQVAAAAHAPRDEAIAWTGLIDITGRRGEPDRALALVPAASAAVVRAGEPIDLRVELLYGEAVVLDESARPTDGLVLITTALALLDRAGASQPDSPHAKLRGDVLFEIANAQWTSGLQRASLETYKETIAFYRGLLGPDSLDEAYAWSNLGQGLQSLTRYDEASDALETAVRIREARLGDSPALALSLVGLAVTRGMQGKNDQSLALFERVLAMDRARLADDDPVRAMAHFGRASTLVHLHRDADALHELDLAIAAMQAQGGATENLGRAFDQRADLRARLGHCDQAAADYASAIDVEERAGGDDNPVLAWPLLGIGECLYHTGRPADAIAPLSRALALRPAQDTAPMVAIARFQLDRARVDSGHDAAKGLADAPAAYAALDPTDPSHPELERWMRAHHLLTTR
ncbi:MAG TPA: tetratricopeptide repeat-containing protein kinase family protein [Kofleriaceae bacterium]|nr:tetratricopeptide repeat-containing protein kinase family protein [Kofleriaceae bacterium]